MNRTLVVSALLGLGPIAGCGPGAAPPRAVAVDTLANGSVRVVSASPAGWRDSSNAWQFEEVTRYGGADGTPGALVDPTQLAQDAEGRVYIGDSRPASIKIFERDGRFLRTIGRHGKGPGEYTAAFLAVQGGLLVVHDPDQRRTTVFDTAGRLLRSWQSACCFWAPIAIDSAFRIYVPSPNPKATDEAQSPRLFVRFDTLGATIDTLAIPPGPAQKEWHVAAGKEGNQVSVGSVIPFAPRVEVDYHPSGGFVYGLSDRYQFVTSRTGGDTVQLVERAWSPESIPESVRVRAVDRVKKWMGKSVDPATLNAAVKLEDVPTQAPAFSGLHVAPDGFVWTSLLDADSTRSRLDIFQPGGAWLGTVVLQFPIGRVFAFGRGEILVAGEDDDGRPIVRRVRIKR